MLIRGDGEKHRRDSAHQCAAPASSIYSPVPCPAVTCSPMTSPPITWSAWRPFWPSTAMKVTRWPSCSVLNPLHYGYISCSKATRTVVSLRIGVYLDSTEVNKQVRVAGLGGDEAESFGIVEPLHGSILPWRHTRYLMLAPLVTRNKKQSYPV